MKLTGKVAIVTGGGTGMGRGICELFGREGAKVVVNYRASKEESEAVAAAINAAGGEAIAFQADHVDESQVKAMIDDVEQRWGRLDILVNNAGWSKVTPHRELDLLTDEIWDRTLDTNLRGPFYCIRQAAPLIQKSGGGAIINNSSASAYTAGGSSLIYSASKAALGNLTIGIARVLAPDIRVNAIAPGHVRTRFAGWSAEAFEASEAASPLGHLPSFEEVAQVVLFLAADATAITGQTILVDSGRTALGPPRNR
jgi:NAD(P)-dependent dehydrogenase (short-subunit alcohol dehydrogenase family)